ncbi:UNVERIFIED_CONTAM: Smr/MutS family protein [Campylobacter lari]
MSYLNKIIDLHGLTVDEAIAQVSFELSFIENYDGGQIELIVGKGTGTLKVVVEDYLIKHDFNYKFTAYDSFIVYLDNNNFDEDDFYYKQKFI